MRPISEIILHCTATPEGRAVSVKEIDAWHRARGWSGIGYHYVVHLDGLVENGRSVEAIGAHVAGHNTGTIGIAYVGGVAKDGVTPKDTRTPSQKATLQRLCTELVDRYKIRRISGHNEYAAKACPSFSVPPEFSKLVLGRPSVPPVAPDAIVKRGDSGPDVDAWRRDLGELRERMRHPYPVPATGGFDHTLEAVTIWFQNLRGILADGTVGPQTREEMSRALADAPPLQALPGSRPINAADVRHHAQALLALTQ